MKWHTEVRKVSDLKNWEDNPRTISNEAYKELKKSINDLGNFEPLVINTDGTVLAGNQRLKIHAERGDTEVEVSVPERELTPEEVKKIGIISNRHSGEWDMDKLANEFEEVLDELGFDELLLPEDTKIDNLYTREVKTPIYDTENTRPPLEELVDKSKVIELNNLINSSNIPEEVKDFLKIASSRFYTFNFSKIADYYANSDEEVQDIMEKLVLVIIDYNKAIEGGFFDFVTKVIEEQEEEYGE